MEIVTEHINSGDFPAWPYAGAMFIEKGYTQFNYMLFRNILNAFRADVERAYKLLVM